MSNGGDQITLVVDGVEVQASAGEMLVDAAKQGDVEIPVFCYEPKLGEPVGACRMCLVEIEGIPKLQTACSTPVRDGMVVYTQTDRVKEAQNSVVEFLLVNHPLDCPVCDKGGECPLQDISMGWGHGKSRVIDAKRHFQKPIPLSPLIKIDRERCILCYRCVRFSQEVAEDEQLQLLERGSSSFVGTFDDRPYIAPFHGNIIELCPVGALTSDAYRFRARPWDIEDAGTVCTLCPSQCNIKLTVRDEKIQRVLARDNFEVDDGWLCDKGRFGYQAIESDERITEPMVRRGGNLEPVGWTEALEAAAEGLRQAGERAAAIVGGSSSNEEGYLTQRIMRRALGSPHVTSSYGAQADRGAFTSSCRGRSSPPASRTSTVPSRSSSSAPTPFTRCRSSTSASARSCAATAPGWRSPPTGRPPSTAAPRRPLVTRRAPSRPSRRPSPARPARRATSAPRARPAPTRSASWACYGPARRSSSGRASRTARSSTLARRARRENCSRSPPARTARGLREVGCMPVAGPGFSEAADGLDAADTCDALTEGGLDAAFLVNADPVRDAPDGPAWTEALTKADFVLAISMFEDASTKHADVVFPAESYAEKEGTVTHPDGRLQRVRPGVPNPGRARPTWEVLVELSALLGEETGIDSVKEALEAIASEVPFYGGITEEEIGGLGVRWQDRDAARNFPPAPGAAPEGSSVGLAGRAPASRRTATSESAPTATSGPRRSPTAAPRSAFWRRSRRSSSHPHDAERLGIGGGDEVDVRSNGTSVRARVVIRERVRPGSGFLIEGLGDLAGTLVGEDVEVSPAGGDE